MGSQGSYVPTSKQARLDGLTDHDQIAPYACALTALCVFAGRYVAAGIPFLGYIMLPPVEVWADVRP